MFHRLSDEEATGAAEQAAEATTESAAESAAETTASGRVGTGRTTSRASSRTAGRTTRAHSSVSLLDKELGSSAASIALIGQVSGSNDKSTSADHISGVAEDLGAVCRVIGDLSLVLEILGITEENGTSDLVTDRLIGISDGSSSKSSSLTVSSSENDSVGTLLSGIVEVTDHLLDRSRGSSARQSVLGKTGSISTTDTLNPNSALAILGLELVTNERTQSTLKG